MNLPKCIHVEGVDHYIITRCNVSHAIEEVTIYFLISGFLFIPSGIICVYSSMAKNWLWKQWLQSINKAHIRDRTQHFVYIPRVRSSISLCTRLWILSFTIWPKLVLVSTVCFYAFMHVGIPWGPFIDMDKCILNLLIHSKISTV